MSASNGHVPATDITVRITQIHPWPGNPRKTFSGIEELAQNVQALGVLTPLLVRPRKGGGYELADGERRYRAAKAAGLAELPLRVRELTDQQMLEIAIVSCEQ